MNILARKNKAKTKIYYYWDCGRGPGQRPATGMFTYTKPKNQIEKNHNQETLALLQVKKSEIILEQQSVGTRYIPSHKLKKNFLDYYSTYVTENKRKGNRHLQGSYNHFVAFLGATTLSPLDVTENLCSRFRKYLLDLFTGDTPSNYFSAFKKMVKSATKERYFVTNPCEGVKAKSNASKKLKEHLEADEYICLLRTPCLNQEVQAAFIFCCYTALRYVDVKQLAWEDVKENQLTTSLIQQKTGKPVTITLHPIARKILDVRRSRLQNDRLQGKVFSIATNNGCNKILAHWVRSAGIDKHITWHSARLSFSILLADNQVDAITISLLLGHSSAKYVLSTYKRHRPKDNMASIRCLPMPEESPHFLNG